MGRDLRGRVRRIGMQLAGRADADRPLVVEIVPAGLDGLTDTRGLARGLHRIGPGRSPVHVYDPATGPDPAVLSEIGRRFPGALQITLGPELVAPPTTLPGC